MAEKDIVAALQAALDEMGIQDQIAAAGQFEPRGASGAKITGGIVGSDIGGSLGAVGDGIGLAAGYVAGGRVNGEARGLPREMVVGASETAIYGFKMARGGRSKEPHELVFSVPREGTTVAVHGRVNVRVLEVLLPDGSKLELEGSRIPLTHSRDVIRYLAGGPASEAADAAAVAAGEEPE